jgi:hypothetical protein
MKIPWIKIPFVLARRKNRMKNNNRLKQVVKRSVYLSLSVLVFLVVMNAGCKTSNELSLGIVTAKWYLVTYDHHTSLMLDIKGITNGDRVTIMTYGDGLPYELDLPLGENKQFNQSVEIAFSYAGYNPPVHFSTVIKAYRGNESIETTLESGNIW